MDKYNWSLEKIYKNIQDARLDIKKCDEIIEKINLEPKTIDNLKNIIELHSDLSRLVEKLFCYSYMKRDEDSRVSEFQKLALDVDSLSTRVSSCLSFFEPFLMSLSSSDLDTFYEKNDNKKYKKYFDEILRFKEHTLSKSEENILASLSSAMSSGQNTFYMLSYADMNYGIVESRNGEKILASNYNNFLLDKNETVRKEAFEKFNGKFKEFKNTYASTLYSTIKNLTTIAKIKKYPSARYMELFKESINETVYDLLILSVEKYLPSLHKYYALRKKALKKDKQYMWDVYLNINEDFNKTYSYEQAKDIILKALKPLGDDYVSEIKKGFENRWIDVYPREGKAAGAYSWGCFDTDPYILMNFTGDLHSIFTLAHELGHSMHSFYARNNNEYIYSSYKMFVAEVASTFNELVLLDYLLKNAQNKEEKIYILNYYINMFITTVFRQTMFAEFEKTTHSEVEKNNSLTAQDFTKISKELNDKYYGQNVEANELADYVWARIPHFYTNFYVYRYATSFCAASFLSREVLNKKDMALENYRAFLKDGCKTKPIEQLKNAGFDMEDKNAIDKALEVFKDLVDKLEFEIGK